MAPLEKYMNDTIYDLVKKISSDFSLDFEEVLKKYNITAKSVPKKKAPSRKKTPSEFVEMSELEHEGTKYLFDNKTSNVYTYDVQNPSLVGQKLVNGAIKFISPTPCPDQTIVNFGASTSAPPPST